MLSGTKNRCGAFFCDLCWCVQLGNEGTRYLATQGGARVGDLDSRGREPSRVSGSTATLNLNHSRPYATDHGFCARPSVQLAEDRVYVEFDCVFGDVETGGNLLIA